MERKITKVLSSLGKRLGAVFNRTVAQVHCVPPNRCNSQYEHSTRKSSPLNGRLLHNEIQLHGSNSSSPYLNQTRQLKGSNTRRPSNKSRNFTKRIPLPNLQRSFLFARTNSSNRVIKNMETNNWQESEWFKIWLELAQKEYQGKIP